MYINIQSSRTSTSLQVLCVHTTSAHDAVHCAVKVITTCDNNENNHITYTMYFFLHKN